MFLKCFEHSIPRIDVRTLARNDPCDQETTSPWFSLPHAPGLRFCLAALVMTLSLLCFFRTSLHISQRNDAFCEKVQLELF